jgi:hypothetical protein
MKSRGKRFTMINIINLSIIRSLSLGNEARAALLRAASLSER